MAGDRISIITTAYIDTTDKLEWANEMIQSVLAQSRHEWELIIFDDHSPIRLWDVYDDPRIKIIRGVDQVGVAVGRNTAAYNASGELLLPLDADDILYPTALDLLYNNYQEDRFVYGNVDILARVNKMWQVSGTVRLPEFTCDLILNPKGIAPVTALHAKNAWQLAGGWKQSLAHGLEDIEYWISCVRTSCTLGKNIGASIIQYRRHKTSRTQKMKNAGEESKMRDAIKLIHADLYGGTVDMGCGCGGGSSPANVSANVTTQQMRSATNELIAGTTPDQYVIMQYLGPRTGSFGVVGNITKKSYKIKGTGFEFPVHRDDAKRFTLMGRRGDPDFVVVGPYVEQQKAIQRAPKKEIEAQPFKPEPVVFLSKIVEVADGPNVEEVVVDTVKADDLTQLPVRAEIVDQLIEGRWTYTQLAQARPGDLRHIKGVGRMTENKIVKFASGKVN